MSNTNEVIAIACGDIHLQHTPPACRAVEPDWYAAMARPLKELADLAGKYNVPILCAGDVFDRWYGSRASQELVNWAIDHLPVMWAIPGQHDLPQHRYEDINKSAYMTLEKAKILEYLLPGESIYINKKIVLTGFPWEIPIAKNKDIITPKKTNIVDIALAHEYNWIPEHSYPTANPESLVTKKRKNLLQFDVVIFGDNHKGFCTKVGKTTVFNCGTLMRRTIDEINYKPRVGLIYADGSVVPHYLDISQDKLDVLKINNTNENNTMDISDFMFELKGLPQDLIDFHEAIKRYLQSNKTDESSKAILLEAMGQ